MLAQFCVAFHSMVAIATACPAPQCHPSVRIEDTYEAVPGVRFVDWTSIIDPLLRDGWQWVGVPGHDPFWVCLAKPKEK